MLICVHFMYYPLYVPLLTTTVKDTIVVSIIICQGNFFNPCHTACTSYGKYFPTTTLWILFTFCHSISVERIFIPFRQYSCKSYFYWCILHVSLLHALLCQLGLHLLLIMSPPVFLHSRCCLGPPPLSLLYI